MPKKGCHGQHLGYLYTVSLMALTVLFGDLRSAANNPLTVMSCRGRMQRMFFSAPRLGKTQNTTHPPNDKDATRIRSRAPEQKAVQEVAKGPLPHSW